MSDDIALELRALREEVAGLRGDIELLARGRLNREQRELLAALFPQAAAVVGDAVFAAVDLAEMPALRPLLDGYTPAALSWLLGRAAGARIAGYRVERVGTDRSGALWQLRGEVTAKASR